LARVAAALLAHPEGHAGKTYRPTGAKLLSPQELANTIGSVLGRKVWYVNAPIKIFSKVVKGMGGSDFVIAQYEQYVQDYQKNTFAHHAPTQVVKHITGREAEDFETIVRQYVKVTPDIKPNLLTMLRLMVNLTLWMLRPAVKTKPHLVDATSSSEQFHLSANSQTWRKQHHLA
jgi:NAD(P)H dehydrogenase (quinone)